MLLSGVWATLGQDDRTIGPDFGVHRNLLVTRVGGPMCLCDGDQLLDFRLKLERKAKNGKTPTDPLE